MQGMLVECPSCGGKLRLPELPGMADQAQQPDAAEDTAPPAPGGPIPMKRSGKPHAGAEPAGSPAGSPAQRTQLPTKRRQEIDVYEEMRRMSAAGAPGPLATPPEETDADAAARQRTALPVRRHVEDLAPGENAARGRPRRPADDTGHAAPGGQLPSIEPIPLKPEAEFAPSPLPATTRRRPAPTPAPEAMAPAPAPTPATAPAPEPPQDKSALKINPDRELHFRPKHEIDTEAEVAEDWGATQTSSAMRRTMVIGIVCFVLAMAGVGTWFALQSRRPADEGVMKEDKTIVEDPTANFEAAKKVLTAFLSAKTPEEKAAYVRNGDKLLRKMRAYYATQAQPPRKVLNWSQDIREVALPKPDSPRETVDFITVRAELEDHRWRMFALEIVPGGEPKLDWEHHAQYSDMPWETFLKTASDSPCAFRVTVTEDDYFIYAFEGKEKDWLCYKLSDPADFGYCWGYCRLDSPAGREIVQKMAEARRLGQVNKQGEVVGQLILELRYPPEGKKSNQVIIEKFVHDSWIVP